MSVQKKHTVERIKKETSKQTNITANKQIDNLTNKLTNKQKIEKTGKKRRTREKIGWNEWPTERERKRKKDI